MPVPPARIVLEIDPGVEPITGRVRAEPLAPRAFTGWTSLFGALRSIADQLGGGAEEPGADGPDPG